jgi:hypothetical protein
MSFCENKKIILNSREAFRIVDCGSKLSCPQDKMIKNLTLKPHSCKNIQIAVNFSWKFTEPAACEQVFEN